MIRRTREHMRPRKMQKNRAGRSTHPSEASLEKLFSNVHAGIAHLDTQFQYVRVNDSYANAGGHQINFYPGKDHFALYPDAEQESIFQRARETRLPFYAYGKALLGFKSGGAASIGSVWDWSLKPVISENDALEGFVLVITDVTAREQAQQALRQTQAMFAHLFEASPDANILTDNEGKITSVNREAEKLFGYKRVEIIGQPVEILVPENLREGHQTYRAGFMRSPRTRAMAAIQSHRLELHARRKDGSTFPAEITLNPLQTETGLVVVSIIRDISERKSREEELSRQGALVQLLQEVAIAANETNNVSSAFQYTIDRLCQHLKWPLGHALLTDEDGSLSSSPLWSKGASSQYATFRSKSEQLRFKSGYGLPGLVLATGQPVWMNKLSEHKQFTRQNEAKEANLRTALAIPVLAGKEVVGVLEFFNEQDIPPDPNLLAVLPHIGVQIGRVVERRRSEDALRKAAAQLRTVIVNLPVILWVINREGRLILLEGKGVAAAGMNPELLLGQSILERLSDRPDMLGYIQRALSGETVHAEVDNAEGHTFETFFTPYFDEYWAVNGVIGLSFDVSDRKQMEAGLEEMKHRLLQSVDTERARLGKQIHDGPLQDLYGAFYQLQEVRNVLEGPEEETIGRALQTIQHVNATLRLICGELRPTTLVHLGLQQAIRSHAERIQDRLEEGRILHLDLPDGKDPLPHPLRLGIFRIYQQLLNNAVNHSGGQHIWVRLKYDDEQIKLQVKDNGKGFDVPTEWIEMVRDGRFGLVSTMERVRGMNGELNVVSEPGQGTEVTVTLPVSIDQAAEPAG